MNNVKSSSSIVDRKLWYRWRNIIFVVLLTLIVSVGWVASEIREFFNSKANPTRNYPAEYRALVLASEGIDAEQSARAWALLTQAGEIYSEIILQLDTESAEEWEEIKNKDEGEVMYYEPSSVRYGIAQPVINDRTRKGLRLIEEAGVFNLLGQHADLELGLRPLDASRPMIYWALPVIPKLRGIAKARCATMRLSLIRGDEDGVVQAFHEIYALGVALSHQQDLMSRLVGLACLELAIDELRHELLEHSFSEAHCDELFSNLNQYPISTINEVLLAERYNTYDTLEWMCNEDGYLIIGGYLNVDTYEPPEKNILNGIKLRFFSMRKEEIFEFIDLCVDWHVDDANRPSVERNPENFEVWMADNLSWKYGDETLYFLLPPMDRAIDQWERINQKLLATKIMVTLNIVYQRHGRYQKSLEELVPEFFPELPIDPICRLPFGYELILDESGEEQYVLYALGLDCIDDGGTYDPEYPFKANNPDEVGSDLVYTMRRREE